MRSCAVLLAWLWLTLAAGFNLDWRHAPVFEDPEGQDGSYFGFSVALRRQGLQQWLVVGAPRAKPTPQNVGAEYQPGAVYQCPLDGAGAGACQRLLVDGSGNDAVQSLPGSPVRQNRSQAWLGGAVVAQEDGDRLLVCAPRWRNVYHSNYYLMNGACYCTSDTSDPDAPMDALLPLVQKSRQSVKVKERGEDYFNYAYGQAGMSAHFPRGATELVLGAPGVYDWRGTVVRYRVGTLSEGTPRRRRRRGTTDTFEAEVPNAQQGKQIPLNSYLGYSLTSGRFQGAVSHHLYAAGAPRAGFYKGHVYVFDFPEDSEREDLVFLAQLEGSQMGEYFGAAVTAVDVNGDGLDDLAVSAPLFSLADQNRASGDEGRVYVFVNDDHKIFREVTSSGMLMGSRKHGARFGTSLANIGDINLDGYEDLAIGAPYEDNGVVYIYHGHDKGVHSRPAQMLRAQDVDHRLRGLGMSLSRGFDVDGNHYNDVAAGAFDSGHAVLFRAHPVVSLRGRLESGRSSIGLDATGFPVTACLAYHGPHAPAAVEVSVAMQADALQGRAHFRNAGPGANLTFAVNLTKGAPEDCKTLEVVLRSGDKDPTKPLDVVMRFRPARDPATAPHFCGTCPVVAPGDPDHVTLRVAFETGCAQAVCRPDLAVSASFEGLGDTVILGRDAVLNLRVKVENKGERAFLARALLTLPRDTPLARLPPSCQESKDRSSNLTLALLCDLGSPLEKAAALDVALNAREVSLSTRRLRFVVNVTSAGDERNRADNSAALELGVGVQADMTVSGAPSQDPLVYVAPNKTLKTDLLLNHTFEAWNVGPSRVGVARLHFWFPRALQGPRGSDVFMEVLEPEARLQPSGTPFTCDPIHFSYWKPAPPPDYGDVDNEPTLPPEDYDEEAIHGRVSKREAAAPLPEAEFPPSGSSLRDAPVNRTLYLNCSHPRVECVEVECRVEGPFLPEQTRAVVSFQLKPFFEVLESTLGQELKDIVLYASQSQVIMEQPSHEAQPPNHRPDGVTVLSMFLGKAPEASVASWIIAVAVICGILILFLIAMALHKMGFFHRAKKEELAAMKAEDDVDSGGE